MSLLLPISLASTDPQFSFTCQGSLFGSCCSKWNYCGDTAAYCGADCNSEYGSCHGVYGRGAKSARVARIKQVIETRISTRYVVSLALSA
jgi:hypothetical protein